MALSFEAIRAVSRLLESAKKTQVTKMPEISSEISTVNLSTVIRTVIITPKL